VIIMNIEMAEFLTLIIVGVAYVACMIAYDKLYKSKKQ